MSNLLLNKACPTCKSTESIRLGAGSIHCENCDLQLQYLCPLCDASLSGISSSEHGFTCPACQRDFEFKKIQHLIENNMIIDTEIRCELCNGPTIHRKTMNLAHRCFHYPKCSGQSGLFGNKAESLVFLDFETTGLEVGRDEIIEFGAVKIDSEGYEHTFQSFVTPRQSLHPKITKITGITPEMLEGAPDLQSTTQAFLEFLGDAKLVAHNADFDVPFLVAACISSNVTQLDPTVICTLKWARSSGEGSCSLGALTRKYKIGHENAHRALADAAATHALYFIFQNLKKTNRPEAKLSDYWENTQKIVDKYSQYARV